MNKKIIAFTVSNLVLAASQSAYADTNLSFIDAVRQNVAPKLSNTTIKQDTLAQEAKQKQVSQSIADASGFLEKIPYQETISADLEKIKKAEPEKTFTVKVEELSGEVEVIKRPKVNYESFNVSKNSDFVQEVNADEDKVKSTLSKNEVLVSGVMKPNTDRLFKNNNSIQLNTHAAFNITKSGEDFAKIKQHVNEGGVIGVKGTSDAKTEIDRIKVANLRMLEMKKTLIRAGISEKYIKTFPVTEYKKQENSGVVLALYTTNNNG